MSKTPERLAYEWLAKNLPPQSHPQRIECTTTPGIPDINLIVEKHEWWMEVKALRANSGIHLRKEQYAWMARRTAVGGRCVVLNRDATGWQIWVITPGRDAVLPASNGHVLLQRSPDFVGTSGSLLYAALIKLSKRP
jgi:hypothetical protein